MMRKIMMKTVLCIILCIFTAMCLSACGKKNKEPELTMEQAQEILENHLAEWGFSENDFLAEGTLIDVNGEQAYAFSWREQVSESADKLSGMYAISCDGTSVYEYQSSRNEWIKAASL